MDNWELLGRGKFPLYPYCVLAARLTMKLTKKKRLIEEKEPDFNSGISFLKEMKPKKWLKQAAFILFDQKKKKKKQHI